MPIWSRRVSRRHDRHKTSDCGGQNRNPHATPPAYYEHSRQSGCPSVPGTQISFIAEVAAGEPDCPDDQDPDNVNVNTHISGVFIGGDCDVSECPVCGDGNLDPGEECDDGNNVDGDGCSAFCTEEPICDLTVTKTATPDVIQPGPMPSCETIHGRPTSLTFQYTGGGCGASSNTQDDSKVECSGAIDGTDSIDISAAGGGNADRDYAVDPMTVQPGGTFDVVPLERDEFESESWFFLSNAGGTELNGQGGGDSIVTYEYLVSNDGSPLADVVVSDDHLGRIDGGRQRR